MRYFRRSEPNGTFRAVLGQRLTLFLGTIGYAVYVGALWWYAGAIQLQWPRPDLHDGQFPNTRHQVDRHIWRRRARRLCRVAVVRAGEHSNELPAREGQRQGLWRVLGNISVWDTPRLHRRASDQH